MEKQWTVLEALNWTEKRFERHGEENARLAAQMLAAHATGLTRIDLYTQFDKPLSEGERTLLRGCIQRRLDGEPLQYIIGTVGFRHLELSVGKPVLIPRPETEILVELVLAYAAEKEDSALCILDIGTGTGAIALSLLHELPTCQLTATDIDEAAVALAQKNASELKLDDLERLQLVQDDLAHSLVAETSRHLTFDVVVSNPPYIPTAEYESLPDEILHFESRVALDGGAYGLDVFCQIAEQALVLLKPGGLLAVELHETALDAAAAFTQSLSYTKVEIHADLTGRPRFLTAQRG